ncbi:FG-GAP repeat domain-containing protein [Streptomyces sp. NPDC058326]|uniref:FG-GAP repeat domain-containing protein n=1 Tax=Streptomyces sp. NPDC058326 TaxID=3346447 RepID=UPI0036E1F18C
MTYVRTTRRHLCGAVATVLAITLGAGALAAPAALADSAAAVGASVTAAEALKLPAGSYVVGAGATGFLSAYDGASRGEGAEYRWTPYDGGAARTMQWDPAPTATLTEDLLAVRDAQGSSVRLRDAATGEATAWSVEVAPLVPGVTFAGAAGRTLFTTMTSDAGATLRAHSPADGLREVKGLPVDAEDVSVRPGTARHAIVSYSTYTEEDAQTYRALVDLTTGEITETYRTGDGNVAVSDTHIAYLEASNGWETKVVVRERGTDESKVIDLGTTSAPWTLEIGLVGDWVTYSYPGGNELVRPSSAAHLQALTARSLKDDSTIKLIDHVRRSGTPTVDGGRLVSGGTVAHGEGVYRIALDEATGKPAATLLASTGESTAVALTKPAGVPTSVDLDKNGGGATFTWSLNRWNVAFSATLRHVRTGKTVSMSTYQPQNGVAVFDWNGDLGDPGAWRPDRSAYNGEYTWEITAMPLSGIGPTLKESGAFTVTRTSKPHDFDDNGAADVLIRDGAGALWLESTYDHPVERMLTSVRTKVGGGWQVYDKIEATGNIAGSAHPDLVAQDASGVLWLYQGNGRGGFATRTQIGGGWQTYARLAGGGDLTGDGTPDLVGTDRAGALWLYKGTGNSAKPFATRQKIGTGGWQTYNLLTATGNIAGTSAGDLVARDKGGVLWLYQGKGDGTFHSRTRIGSGWSTYSDIVGVGDANHDGRPDLIANSTTHSSAYFYAGTGNTATPFKNRAAANLQTNRSPYHHWS